MLTAVSFTSCFWNTATYSQLSLYLSYSYTLLYLIFIFIFVLIYILQKNQNSKLLCDHVYFIRDNLHSGFYATVYCLRQQDSLV
jgi:hypothetical protein